MAKTCVVIGDIRQSRKLQNWPKHLSRLEAALAAVNKRWSDDLEVRFGITVGDEFQGALKHPVNLYDMILQIRTIPAVGLYLGIGFGEIEKMPRQDKGMRGSAFYNARDALEKCKSRSRHVLVKSAESNIMDDIVNTFLGFLEATESSWTERQAEIVSFLRLHPDQTGEDLARRFEITRQAISQHLASANWAVVQEGDKLVSRIFREMYI
jgi:hypothetical protein